MPDVKVAIVYYSATGSVFALAQAAADAAKEAGAEVRLLKVHELAPQEAIQSNEGWAAHALSTQDEPEASNDDLEWADVILLGSPTRYGLPTAQLKQFLDQTGPLWGAGKLVNKVASSFTSTGTAHGGQETTILAINNTFYHWGSIIVAPGYADPIQFQAGNPTAPATSATTARTRPVRSSWPPWRSRPAARSPSPTRSSAASPAPDPCRRAAPAEPVPLGAPGRVRTCDLPLRRRLLCPAELRAHGPGGPSLSVPDPDASGAPAAGPAVNPRSTAGAVVHTARAGRSAPCRRG